MDYLMDWLTKLEALFLAAAKATTEDRTGVIFSGGVDSVSVAYAACRFCDATAYHVGVSSAEDTKFVRRIEKTAPFKIRYVELSLGDVEAVIPEILAIWKRPSPLDIGVAIPFYMASKQARAEGQKTLLCGQGGDELFGGYWRYLDCLLEKGPTAVSEWMQRDWENARSDNLDRDMSMCQANGCELRFPFLDKAFSEYSLALPFEYKIRENCELACDAVGGRAFVRKYALKKLAMKLGVPEYIINRAKKAAQYGSGTNGALDKIARMHGYKAKALSIGRRDYVKLYLEDILANIA
jgi:asparagine synthase (glutamine-hydrolysing)